MDPILVHSVDNILKASTSFIFRKLQELSELSTYYQLDRQFAQLYTIKPTPKCNIIIVTFTFRSNGMDHNFSVLRMHLFIFLEMILNNYRFHALLPHKTKFSNISLVSIETALYR